MSIEISGLRFVMKWTNHISVEVVNHWNVSVPSVSASRRNHLQFVVVSGGIGIICNWAVDMLRQDLDSQRIRNLGHDYS